MRLLLSLLSDGLPCLSVNTAFEEREGPGVDRLVKAFAAAVKAVGAVAECHRLAALEQSAGGTWAGSGGEGDASGFSMLLCEALSLVTAAVSVDVAPLVEKGSGDAAVRAEILTLFFNKLYFFLCFLCFSECTANCAVNVLPVVFFCLVWVPN